MAIKKGGSNISRKQDVNTKYKETAKNEKE
jgi:hypothetical protein